MKKKIASSIVAFAIVILQFSQVFGAGTVQERENAAMQAKLKDQKILEEKRENEEKALREGRELEEEKRQLAEAERHYSDRFLVKYADGRSRAASGWESCAEAAFKEAKKQKDAQETAMCAKIKDAGERQAFYIIGKSLAL